MATVTTRLGRLQVRGVGKGPARRRSSGTACSSTRRRGAGCAPELATRRAPWSSIDGPGARRAAARAPGPYTLVGLRRGRPRDPRRARHLHAGRLARQRLGRACRRLLRVRAPGPLPEPGHHRVAACTRWPPADRRSIRAAPPAAPPGRPAPGRPESSTTRCPAEGNRASRTPRPARSCGASFIRGRPRRHERQAIGSISLGPARRHRPPRRHQRADPADHRRRRSDVDGDRCPVRGRAPSARRVGGPAGRRAHRAAAAGGPGRGRGRDPAVGRAGRRRGTLDAWHRSWTASGYT